METIKPDFSQTPTDSSTAAELRILADRLAAGEIGGILIAYEDPTSEGEDCKRIVISKAPSRYWMKGFAQIVTDSI